MRIVCAAAVCAALAFAGQVRASDDRIRKHAEAAGAKPEHIIKWVPLVMSYSHRHGVDPLLVAVIIGFESKWDPDVKPGKLGEMGLMQCHPDGCGRRLYRGKKSKEQWLESAIHWLALCKKDAKGSLWFTLLLYMTGKKDMSSYDTRTAQKVRGRVNRRFNTYVRALGWSKWK